MSIQRLDAQNKGLDFEVEYENIMEDDSFERIGHFSPFINCDEQRIMQVLLGLQANALKFTSEGKVKIYAKIV
jgi:signal transduction histidine kinase